METQSKVSKLILKSYNILCFSRDIPHMTFFSFPRLLYAMLHFSESVWFSLFFLNIMSVNLTCFIKSYSLLFFLFGFIFISLCTYFFFLCTYFYIKKIFENTSIKARHSSREVQNELGRNCEDTS